MANSLQGKKVAILVENGFEQVELTDPRKALDDAGAQTKLVSPVKGQVGGQLGRPVPGRSGAGVG